MQESKFLDYYRDGSIKTIIAVHWRRVPIVFSSIIDNSLYLKEEINPFDMGWVL
jgi:hypothetical protein